MNFDFLTPVSNFGSNTAPILEGGEEGTATKMQRMSETSYKLKTSQKTLQLAMMPITECKKSKSSSTIY